MEVPYAPRLVSGGWVVAGWAGLAYGVYLTVVALRSPPGTALTGHWVLQPPFKASMALLLTVAAVAHPIVRERRWLMPALLLSAVGDWLLAIPWWTMSFGLGLAAFLLAHLCFLGALIPLARISRVRLAAVVFMCLVTLSLLTWFWPHLARDKLTIPVTLYMIVLTAMVSMAILADLPTIWTAVGAVCFAASDTMIAIGRFILYNDALAVPIWWLYAAAQVLITAGFFFGREEPYYEADYVYEGEYEGEYETDYESEPDEGSLSVPLATKVTPEVEPIARVLPMLSVPHLDREFDYLVSAEQSDDAQPGVRVRVRFHGRLVDGFVLERRNDTDHTGKLGWLDRVVSAEPVLTQEIRRLVDAVAARYAGTRPDVLRLAVPARHARVEREPAATLPLPAPPIPAAVDPSAWEAYGRGGQFLGALAESRAARAVWQALPGEPWADRFAEAAAQTVRAGRAALAIVPDQRDLDTLWAAATTRIDKECVVALSAGLGPAARYRRWLAALRGTARVVIGTRSAVFAPLADLGLVMVWADADDSLAEPRAPYPHAREVAMLRAHQARCAALIGGYARTAEAHALVRSGWAHDIVAARPVVRARTPRVIALDDTGYADERDPAARTARIPSIALRAARSSLEAGAPVLVQVPRRGYVPSLACGRCRAIARCRQCTGPLSLQERGPGAVCRWCGRAEPALRCARCGSDAVRAVVVGARRTAEELGRAFAGTPVVTSAGDAIVAEVADRPALVVATPGAEPRAAGGYGAALLLDTWALLGRQDLRAAEDALWRWMSAAALVRARGDGGVVMVVAESSIPTVQSLIRWDPVGHAEAEVTARAEVGLPPSVHMAAIDGTPGAIAALLEQARLPDGSDVLGPVDLPAGVRRPAGTPAGVPVTRMLVRVRRAQGLALAAALRSGVGVLSARLNHEPVRVQIDPLHIG